MKRFLIGFIVGFGLMYWYLHNAEIMQSSTRSWFQRSASDYRGDKEHEAARDALAESELRR